MTVALYMDVHVRGAVTRGLRQRGVDVLTAQEDGHNTAKDPTLMDRVTALGRTLFTHDQDFLVEGAVRQQTGRSFSGVVYGHQLAVSIGKCIYDLELIAKVMDPLDMANQVLYLPL